MQRTGPSSTLRFSLDRGGSSGFRIRQLRAARGLTLFEVLIVVALIGILTGAVLLGTGVLGGARMRASSSLISAGIRLGLNRANSTGRPVRMVFDFESNRVILEETSGTMLREKEEDNTGGGAEAATEAERAAREEAEKLVKAPRAPRPSFTPVKEFGFESDDGQPGRGLESGVSLRRVQTEHDSEPRTAGRAYLYFFPGGGTERASIQLEKGKSEDDGVSILVNGLTGRTKLERGWVDLEPPREDDGYGEREE
ncbi:MAG: prepilin-type N-terminal cleavage/methylation domain-containing protein [Myxococcales bacterium]|nr:prepilin-type N-terminal cleavage/methylation domain-containing protein [Myxococcales bacterium]